MSGPNGFAAKQVWRTYPKPSQISWETARIRKIFVMIQLISPGSRALGNFLWTRIRIIMILEIMFSSSIYACRERGAVRESKPLDFKDVRRVSDTQTTRSDPPELRRALNTRTEPIPSLV